MGSQAFITTLAKNFIATNPKGSNPNWPMPKVDIIECYLRIAPYFLKTFLSLVKEARQKGFPEADIARSFRFPSIIVRIAYFLFLKKLNLLSQEELSQVVEYVDRFIHYFPRDPYCLDGRHLLAPVYTEDRKRSFRISRGLKKQEFDVRLISGIATNLFLLTEFLYMDAHNVGHEFHGPYTVGTQNLIVKHFHNLQPPFWPETKKLGFREFVLYLRYPKDAVNVSIDFSNRIYTSDFLFRHVVEYGIRADGVSASRGSDIQSLSQSITKTLHAIIQRSARMRKKEILEKFMFYRFYMLKPLADLVGRSWKPSQALMREILT